MSGDPVAASAVLPAWGNADAPDADRRFWLRATGTAGGIAVIATVAPLVSSLAPSERARAAGGPVEVDIAGLAPGSRITIEWRGKPVWIVRRTPQMLAALHGHEAELADPLSLRPQQPAAAQNPARSLREDVFVAVGICTHLGCSPTDAPAGGGQPSLPADWPGGFFCPCHGSTFDGAGRVYKNKPAPSNLEVPDHRYLSPGRLLIGSDAA